MHDTFVIELAGAADISAIATMSRDLIERGLGWRWTPDAIARSLADRASNVVVAREGDALIGFGIMRYGDTQAHLMLFGVLPGQRRRGVGTALLHWLEATAATAGIELIFLEARASNAPAREFYRRNGYRELAVLSGYYRGKEDAVRIGKDLAG